jgi:4,5-DOPA dioxygenase extradiol
MTSFPTIFVSHGAPTLIIEDAPAHHFLAGLGKSLGRPKAILIASAHWETEQPSVSAVARPETIHDFGGFPRELYQMHYRAPGAPELAQRATTLLSAAGIAAQTDPGRGLDHGAWCPLMLMYPEADVPVTQLAIQSQRDARHHAAVGAALAPLRDEGVLIIGSGSTTHNLREFRGNRLDSPPPPWVNEFADWLHQAIENDRRDDVLDFETKAPQARRNHPTTEHFLPLFVALGAGGGRGKRIHASHTYGILAMDAYQFGTA